MNHDKMFYWEERTLKVAGQISFRSATIPPQSLLYMQNKRKLIIF